MLGKFITHCEDSLTASVLTHLMHLPMEVCWRIIQQACYTAELPDIVGEPSEVQLWPKWNAASTGNAYYVEPDVFLRFRDFDLIIEAKRWDDGQQDAAQWRREVLAYANEYGHEGKPLRMIALGGIHHEHDDHESVTVPAAADGSSPAWTLNFPVHMCRWRGLLYQCQRMLRELEGLRFPTSQTAATCRVLADVIDLFAWHSYSTRRWFADADFRSLALSRQTQFHHNVLQSISHRLSAS